MFRLTRKAGYGLMAFKYLAEHVSDPLLSARDIAEAYQIPAQRRVHSMEDDMVCVLPPPLP
jgi:DNA-binding IscR family transcriptional regulator